ncbi:MAG: flagellar type III secretion system pore protein FliP [Proteobacteria bacterium]|nr:flagellar type III secretion system pore protein FliP [Pseudomonadota bacterium]MCP4919865.1 flagellar type III secretion system pore protein FliP [Pseudomonadota bacterium]
MLFALLATGLAFAQDAPIDGTVTQSVEIAGTMLAGQDDTSSAVRIIVLLTAMSFLPAVLLVMTPFTRFIIVFSLLRQALGLQQSPPNQVLIGLALFMSLIVMGPQARQVQETALDPYMAGEMETGEAIDLAMIPMREFMLDNTHKDSMATMLQISRLDRPTTLDDIPSPVVISAFVLSELETAFVIAVKVYIPFLVIDLVVASVLLGMGMMVLPPVVISLPFKLLVFVLMDGWGLLVTNMVASFQ